MSHEFVLVPVAVLAEAVTCLKNCNEELNATGRQSHRIVQAIDGLQNAAAPQSRDGLSGAEPLDAEDTAALDEVVKAQSVPWAIETFTHLRNELAAKVTNCDQHIAALRAYPTTKKDEESDNGR